MEPAPIHPADRAQIMAWRRAKRKELLAARASLSPEAHREKSRAVLARVLSQFTEIRTGRVGIYWPVQREVSLFPLANHVIAAGGTIALPALAQAGQPMQFRAWRPGEPLADGVWDIPFPRDGPTVEPNTLIVALVGFDQANFRLGYGGGYYDSMLSASTPRPWTIGIGFEFMRLEKIWPLPHDVPMDVVVTETGAFFPADR
jgi:5-formyltetrahydrofolate cyclo-ligase